MGKIIGKRDFSAYWSDGWTHTDVDANAVLDEMSVLDEGFTPDDLVSLASDPQKQLHRCFTWDDTKAATQWRRQEARFLCCHLKVQYIESDKPSDSEPKRLEVRHYGEVLPYFPFQPVLREFFPQDRVAFPHRFQTVPGNGAGAPHAQARTGEGLPVHHVVGKT